MSSFSSESNPTTRTFRKNNLVAKDCFFGKVFLLWSCVNYDGLSLPGPSGKGNEDK